MIPVKHGEGNWYGDAELVAALEARGQVVLATPRTSTARSAVIAGVTNEAGTCWA